MAKNRRFAAPPPRNPSVYGPSQRFAYILPIICVKILASLKNSLIRTRARSLLLETLKC